VTDDRLGSGAMFDGIADRYDVVNRIISLGIDQRWRRKAVNALELGRFDAPHVLDLATGTGDLAIEIAASHPRVTVLGVDPSTKMLDVASRKIREKGLESRIGFGVGEAESLPLEDASVDGVTIAFGIRNVADRPKGLREMARVLRPEGKIAILELTDPENGFLRPFARLHIHTIVPALGGLISGRKEYRYLERSIAAFPPPSEFVSIIEEAGLVAEQVIKLTFGVAHIFVCAHRRTA
jgi:demethylmenaquinone methyltransferase/2-methoxy-6-polyprenyl-1,4-benzoquinol methylase